MNLQMQPEADPHEDLRSGLGDQMSMARALFNKLQCSERVMDKVRKVLDKLLELQDNVTPDDVIDAGGQLVATGLGSTAVATLLAQMPAEGGGEALAGWLNHIDQMATQREQELQAQIMEMRHRLAQAALHHIIAHVHGAGEDPAQDPAPVPSPPPSPLTMAQ